MWRFGLMLVVAMASLVNVRADEALHAKIDRLVEAHETHRGSSSLATDEEFLRRVYLDLAGRIPTYAEASAFLGSDETQKRETLIENLLDGDDYPRRMQELFHVMLLERRGDSEEWTRFLRQAFEQNKSWDAIARNIIKPDADDENARGAAFFMTQRLVKEGAMAPVDVPGLTRDVGRLFAGVDLQCAQCHDHLTVSDYLQSDFQGLNMIFENVQTRKDVKFPAVSENAMTESKEFKSVFDQVAMKTGPVVPGGAEVEIPHFEKGEEYLVKPDRKKKVIGVPRFSPLGRLADELTRSDNELFARNIANRLWFVMMGRGLIEPLDLQHAENPATHPELLKLLATEFGRHEFDIRWYVGELAKSRTYQRSSLVEDAAPVPTQAYRQAVEKRISAEQMFWSMGVATGEFEAVRSARISQCEAEKKNAEAEQTRTATFEEMVAQSEDLQASFKEFCSTFANRAREPETNFEPTVRGALFLMHDMRLRNWLEPRDGNLLHALSNEPDNASAIDRLFLSVLSRHPTDDERTELVSLLINKRERRPSVLRNIMWAMLTSTEFVVNH